MLTVEVATSRENKMKISHLTLSFALALAATACTAERALSPQASGPIVGNVSVASATQVPLLFVVDGVRLQRDQVPSLTDAQIASVTILKGHAALRDYGPDGSYGVVVITTKAALAPRS
jgi:outer membrane receptor protein involved in Fe transport